MNTQRAKEIAESAVNTSVTYEGKPVYIQHVDEEEETARIFPLESPENEQTVPIRNLIEQ